MTHSLSALTLEAQIPRWDTTLSAAVLVYYRLAMTTLVIIIIRRDSAKMKTRMLSK